MLWGKMKENVCEVVERCGHFMTIIVTGLLNPFASKAV